MPHKRCSSCGELVKGHNGPTGSKCHRDEDQTESDSQTTHLLVQELTKLNLAMEKMTNTQSEILQMITSSPMKAPNPASVPDGGVSASVSGVGANVPAVVSRAGSITYESTKPRERSRWRCIIYLIVIE